MIISWNDFNNTKEQRKKLKLIKALWREIKSNTRKDSVKGMLAVMEASINLQIAELAQCAAVLQKIQNTIRGEKK